MSSPITPVFLGLAIVLGVGLWVMREDAPTSGDKTAQTDPKKDDTGTAQPAAPQTGAKEGGTSTSPPAAAAPKTEPDPAPKPAPKTESTTSADKAILDGRSRIDRSGGAAKTMLVTAYYSDGLTNGMSLQPVEIKVPHSVGRIAVTVDQILNPPQELKLYSNIPEGTKVLGVNLKNGVAYVDLSPEVTKVRGSSAVNNIMASFVYSLTAIPDVKAVQLWVNGHPATLDGIEWTKPLSRADMDARGLYKLEPVIKYAGS